MITKIKNLLTKKYNRLDPNSLDPKYQKILVAIEYCGGKAGLGDIAEVVNEEIENTKNKLDSLAKEGYIVKEQVNENIIYTLNDLEKDLEESLKLKYRRDFN